MHPENNVQLNWQKALEAANSQKRCGAKTRSKTTCMSPAMLNGRCRMHGGKSPGAPRGFIHGKYKHGLYTIESKIELEQLKILNKEARRFIQDFHRL